MSRWKALLKELGETVLQEAGHQPRLEVSGGKPVSLSS